MASEKEGEKREEKNQRKEEVAIVQAAARAALVPVAERAVADPPVLPQEIAVVPLLPFAELNYDQFSKMTEERAFRIRKAHNCSIVLGNLQGCLWHNWYTNSDNVSEAAIFHFSIKHDPVWMERAFSILFPRFLELKKFVFKIAYQEALFLNVSRNFYGKEFVLFENWDSVLDGSVANLAKEGGELLTMIKKLKEAGIPRGHYPLGDVPVKGGEGYLYFRMPRNIFGAYMDPTQLAEWDFSRRESFNLVPAYKIPDIENSVFEEDPWAEVNKKINWNDPLTYVDRAIADLFFGFLVEHKESRFAAWFEELVDRKITLKFYINAALLLRTKAMKELKIKEEDYPMGCLVPVVYYRFILPLYLNYYKKGKNEIDLCRPLKECEILEKKLIIAMAAASFREKGVQYLYDFPHFIKPVQEKYQNECDVINWLGTLF